MENPKIKLQNQKKHLEEYKELIAAMFKIKNKQIQQKILNVLNEESNDKNSNEKRFIDKSIQTDDIEEKLKVPENLFTVARIRELNKQTQTCERDFYDIKEIDYFNLNLVKEEPKSEIFSGLPIKEKGRNKKVNIPHAKKSVNKPSSNDAIFSRAEIKTNKRLSKSYVSLKIKI